MAKGYKLWHRDCFEVFPELKDNSVDLVFCDPPYGITACKWDSCLDFGRMWEEVNRVVRPGGAIVFTACQPFTTLLIGSNLKRFKCEWIWSKNTPSNFAVAKYQPLRQHESVLVFSSDSKKTAYHPIKEDRINNTGESTRIGEVFKRKNPKGSDCYGLVPTGKARTEKRYPSTIQYFAKAQTRNNPDKHPTQKPVSLCEYFIKTYSKPGELVLDFAMGSGTTGVAAIQTGRRFFGIELEEKYFELAERRIKEAKASV